MSGQRMHADEIDTDAGLVRRLLARDGGRPKGKGRRGGCPLILLVFKGAVLPVVVPVPLAKGEPAEGYPWHWSIYPWFRTTTRRTPYSRRAPGTSSVRSLLITADHLTRTEATVAAGSLW